MIWTTTLRTSHIRLVSQHKDEQQTAYPCLLYSAPTISSHSAARTSVAQYLAEMVLQSPPSDCFLLFAFDRVLARAKTMEWDPGPGE